MGFPWRDRRAEGSASAPNFYRSRRWVQAGQGTEAIDGEDSDNGCSGLFSTGTLPKRSQPGERSHLCHFLAFREWPAGHAPL